MSDSGFKVHAMELGPMLNFVYLVEDIGSRRCAVVDPAWEVDDIVRRAAELDLARGLAAVQALSTIVWARSHGDREFEREGWGRLQQLRAAANVAR